jgi:hypothetical protein
VTETSPSSAERPLIESALAQVRALRASAPAEPPELPELPGYEIRAELHRGGQGIVYRGVQRATGQDVAVKFLREEWRSESARARFEREVRVLARLKHPNLVAIHDCGVHAGRLWYAMDHVAGRDLDRELAERPRPLGEEVALFARVARAVGAAHQRGVLHRDLKPSNIRIDESGEPRLLDFGLARWLTGEDRVSGEDGERALTTGGGFVGSAPWASPEQVEGGPVDVRSDVYSLGVVAFHGLTGSFPYDVTGPLARIFESIRSAPPARASWLRREIDSDLETILATALAKEPERRYASALDLARDLEHWLAGRPIDARRASRLYVLRKTLRRHWLASTAALGVLALSLAFVLSLAHQRQLLAGTVEQLEMRLHAEELRALAAASERGDGRALEAALASVPAARTDWVVGHFRGSLERRRWVHGPRGERVLAAALSPDERTLAVGAWEGALRLLAVEDGRVLWEERERLSEVLALAFATEGRRIAALASDGISLFDAGSGSFLGSFEWPEGGLEALSVGGERALAASAAGVVIEVGLAEPVLLGTLHCSHPPRGGRDGGSGERSGVELTAVHAGAGRVATVGRDLLRAWEIGREEPLWSAPVASLERYQAPRALSFSDDGERVAVGLLPAGTAPGAVLVYDARTGRRLHAVENLEQGPAAIALRGTDECWIGSTDGVLRCLELPGGRTLSVLPGSARALDQVLVTRDLAVALGVGLTLWNLEPPLPRFPFRPRALAVSAEGAPLAAGFDQRRFLVGTPSSPALELSRPSATPLALALDPASDALVALFPGGAVVWLPLSGRGEVTWELGLTLRALAARGGRILCATLEGGLFALDPRTRGSQLLAEGPPRPAALAFDGERIAVAHEGRVALIEHGQRGARFDTEIPDGERPTALYFLDGQELLAAGTAAGRVWILELARGAVLCPLPGRHGEIAGLAYDAARAELVSVDTGGRLTRWSSVRAAGDRGERR